MYWEGSRALDTNIRVSGTRAEKIKKNYLHLKKKKRNTDFKEYNW